MINLIGFLLPALIDLFNRRIKDTDTRFWISVWVCIGVGSCLATLETNGFKGLSIQDISELISVRSMAMFGMAQITYKQVWENSSLRDSMGMNAKTLPDKVLQ